MKPTYNLLEEYIMKMYQSIGIYHPHQLDNEDISSRLGMVLVYMPAKSFNVENLIVLDERNSYTEQWQDFGHELCHALMHIGNQNRMPLPFRLYQEWKASNFSLHVCIPTFMLDKMELPNSEAKAVNMIHETFGVEYSFAQKRLDQYLRNKMCIS